MRQRFAASRARRAFHPLSVRCRGGEPAAGARDSSHAAVDAQHGEFVTDEIADRFSVLGTLDRVKATLRELESIGVDQYNIYLMTHGQEEILKAYGDDIIPDFTSVAA